MKVSFFKVSIVSIALLVGCGGSGGRTTDGPVGQVTGKVTSAVGDLPEGTTIVFTPEGDSGILATSVIESDGSFKLRTQNSFDVPTGIYKISIAPPAPKEMSDEDAMRASIEGTMDDGSYKEVPEKYRNPATSGETFEVKEGTENVYTLEMKPE